VQCSAVQCSAVQCSAVQCSAVQCNAGQRWHFISVLNLASAEKPFFNRNFSAQTLQQCFIPCSFALGKIKKLLLKVCCLKSQTTFQVYKHYLYFKMIQRIFALLFVICGVIKFLNPLSRGQGYLGPRAGLSCQVLFNFMKKPPDFPDFC
jgi:hypothetical protein